MSGEFFYSDGSFHGADGNYWFSFWGLLLATCTEEKAIGQVIAAIERFILGGMVLPYNFAA